MTSDVEYSATLNDDQIEKSLADIIKNLLRVEKRGDEAFKKIGKSSEKAGKAAEDAGKKSESAFSRLKSGGLSAAGAITAVAGAITAVVVGIKKLTDAAVESDKAMINLAGSAAAANREFGDSVGTAESWEATVKSLSAEMRVFSEQEVTTASARLVDMTKRLGLNEQQMQEVLRRTGDLAAGKTDLVGAVERTTAALRGEAESAEFLGLSLSETAVRQYAESQGLVFKELSDSEVAQQRYNLFLSQTNELQGRAAAFAETLAGKEAELAAQWENQSVVLGEQLLPLREGAARALGLLASESDESSSIVTNALAGIAAVAGTVALVVVSSIKAVVSQFAVLSAAATAALNFEDPIAAARAASEEAAAAIAFNVNVLKNLPNITAQAFNDIKAGWVQQRKDAKEAGKDFGAAAPTITEIAGPSGEALEAQDKIAAALEKAALSLERKLFDIEAKGQQDRLNQLIKNSQKRIDLAKANARAIEAIELKNQQAIADAGVDLSRDEEDIARKAARDRVAISKDAAKAEISAEEDFQNELRSIKQRFQFAAESAERGRDAVAFLAAQRAMEQEIGVATEGKNQKVDEAKSEAIEKRDALNEQLKFELEDAKIANARKLEDLQQSLERELESQRLKNERQLEDQALAEQRQSEQFQRAQDERVESANLANARKLEDLKVSLEKEFEAVAANEAAKTEIVALEAKKQHEILKGLEQQAANAAAVFANPGTLTTGQDLPGFQHGGRFTVGGSGGADSQAVAFRATPGERVSITPPGARAVNLPLSQSVINNAGSVDNSIRAEINQSMLDPAQQSAEMRLIAKNQAKETFSEIMGGRR